MWLCKSKFAKTGTQMNMVQIIWFKILLASWFFAFTLNINLESHSSITNTPADIYLLKVNKRNTRTRCEICSKLTIKTPERRRWLNVLSNNSTNFCLASLFPFFSQCYLIKHFPSKRKFTNFLFLWKLWTEIFFKVIDWITDFAENVFQNFVACCRQQVLT